MRILNSIVLIILYILMPSVSFGYGGIGVSIKPIPSDIEGYFNFVIDGFLQNSPAKQAGLHVGDIFSIVDNTNVFDSISTEEDARKFLSLLRGEAGSQVSITVYRKKDYLLWEGKESMSYIVERIELNENRDFSNIQPSQVCHRADQANSQFEKLKEISTRLSSYSSCVNINFWYQYKIIKSETLFLATELKAIDGCSGYSDALSGLISQISPLESNCETILESWGETIRNLGK